MPLRSRLERLAAIKTKIVQCSTNDYRQSRFFEGLQPGRCQGKSAILFWLPPIAGVAISRQTKWN